MEARFTLGVYGFIFDEFEGKLLLCGTSNVFLTIWNLPGKIIKVETAKKARSEWFLGDELSKEILDKMGLDIMGKIPPMPAMYATISAGGEDISIGIYVGVISANEINLIKCEYKFVSPKELEELAQTLGNNYFIDRSGGRMYRLCLAGLTQSPNKAFRKEVRKMLLEQNWPIGRLK